MQWLLLLQKRTSFGLLFLWALEYRFMVVAHSLSGVRDFPGSRTESMPPALVGEFSTTEPLGSPIIFLNILSGFFFFFF